MTKKKEAGATPRQYEAAFKAEAVRLWQSSGQAAEKTAHELGLSVFNLYKWKREGPQAGWTIQMLLVSSVQRTHSPGCTFPPQKSISLGT